MSIFLPTVHEKKKFFKINVSSSHQTTPPPPKKNKKNTHNNNKKEKRPNFDHFFSVGTQRLGSSLLKAFIKGKKYPDHNYSIMVSICLLCKFPNFFIQKKEDK